MKRKPAGGSHNLVLSTCIFLEADVGDGKGLGVGYFLSSIQTASTLIGCKAQDVKSLKVAFLSF